MRWLFPLKLNYRGITNDLNSFFGFEWKKEIEIPVGDHVGAFGVTRRHDVHKGVDLYADKGEPVYVVEDGNIVHIRQFTGEALGTGWWNDTWAVSVEGKSGVIVYGEIIPVANIKDIDSILAGDLIGYVDQVLKKNKGRPQSMLHFSLHNHGVLSNGEWRIGEGCPVGLLDPTNDLIRSDKEWWKKF